MDSVMQKALLEPMVQFEQLAWRSKKTKTCASCGDPGTVVQGPTRYCHVPYFFCDDCADYWASQRAQ